MEKVQADHIRKNVYRLTKCTKDETTWYCHLLRHGFFTPISWETINKKESDTESIIREMYFHCIKTPKYTLLIQSLKDSDNHTAVKILEELSYTTEQKTRKEFMWFDIHPATKYYMGRDKELEILQKCLQESIDEKRLMIMQITGVGGVGKSELAKQFVKNVYIKKKHNCIWINSESIQTIFDSLQRIAKEVGVSLKDELGNQKDLQLLSFDIYKTICEEHSIFVFANVKRNNNNDMVVFKSLLEYTNGLPPTKIRPFCLLTSSSQLVAQQFVHVSKQIALNVLTEEAAVSLFMAALEVNEDSGYSAVIKSICKHLEFLPLAIQQALAYIKGIKQNDDVATALKIYVNVFDTESKKQIDLPSTQLESLGGISKTTYSMWQATVDQIQTIPEIGSNAENVLNIISFFHSNNIDVEFVSKIAQINFDFTLKCFEVLDNYSVCQIHKHDVSVHSLVQEVVRIRLEQKGLLFDFLHNLSTIVEKMFEDHTILFSELIHVVHIWKYVVNQKGLVQKHLKLPDYISSKYDDLGRYIEGFEFSCYAVEVLESILGKDDMWTLRMTCWKGVFNSCLGKYQIALEILKTVYEKQRKLGDAEDQALKTARQIASVCWKLKNCEESMKWATETLRKRESNYLKDHPEILDLKNIIALVHKDQGRFTKALDIHHEVLEANLRIHGSEHKKTLITKTNIAGILYCQKKLDEALKIHEEVMHTAEQIMGRCHPNTLNSKNWIGFIKWKQGNPKDGLRILEEVLSVRETVLGINHPNTLKTKAHIDKIKANGPDKEGCVVQ